MYSAAILAGWACEAVTMVIVTLCRVWQARLQPCIRRLSLSEAAQL